MKKGRNPFAVSFFFSVFIFISGLAAGQTIVFQDDFSSNQNSAWITSGTIGSSGFQVNRSGEDWGARRNITPAQLELTNDASDASNINGWVFAYKSSNSFESPYNTALSSNPGEISWSFNIRQIRPDPAGFGSGNYGAAFVLATSSDTPNNSGIGYAIVYGQSGNTDPIRLVKFSNGLSGTLINIIISNTIGLTDFGSQYISCKVTYDPVNSEWELFLRNDGTSGFSDPLNGSLTSQGTEIDNNYTSSSLGFLGAYWQGSTAANQTAFFDNFSVSIQEFLCTPPTTHASELSVTGITNQTANLFWTKGNGTSSLVVIREEGAVSEVPVNQTTYFPSAIFGEGDDLGNGNYVVYSGTGNSLSLEGLEGGTTYHVLIFPFNCSGGNEAYFTGGTPASIAFTTPPSQATGLTVTCTDANSATITWNNPSGNFDGVVIGMREGTLIPHQISGTNPGDISANAIFGSGYPYGSTDPKSYAVFKGTETSVTVTGLTGGLDYTIRAYAFKGNTWAIQQHTISINNLGVPETYNHQATPLNQAVTLGWSNPLAGCFDEVIIVTHTASISGTPEGVYEASSQDFTDAANPDFPGGGKVVFNGVAPPVTISGLTNGTTYYFRFFVRKGESWSEGIEITAVPDNITLLDYGDLAILGINTNIDGTSTDELIFVVFRDLLPNTSIDFTDNGFERSYLGYWGTTEGVMRLTRKNSTLPKGTVIKIRGKDFASNFRVFINGTEDAANWEVSSLNGTNQFNLNSEDQVWFMQGGFWDVDGQHKGRYSGKILFGWTATGWKENIGTVDPEWTTHGSRLYPGAECSNTNVTGLDNKDKVKYNGLVTEASSRQWITRINNSANWTGYPDTGTYETGGTFGHTLPVIDGPVVFGNPWVGDKNKDWFDCANWGSFKVPDENMDVIIKDVTNKPIIAEGIAKVRNLFIEGSDSLTMNNPLGVLEVYGNWEYPGSFHAIDGTVIFKGASTQTIATGSFPSFYNLTIDNYYGLDTENDIQVRNTLKMLSGDILSEGNLITVGESETSYGSIQHTSGHVFGKLKRWIPKATTNGIEGEQGLIFPVGKPNLETPAWVKFTDSPILGGSLTAEFISPMAADDFLDEPIIISGDPDLIIDDIPDEGFWRIDAGNALKGGIYTLTLDAGDIQEINAPEGIRILKRNFGDDASNYNKIEGDWHSGSNLGSGFGNWDLWETDESGTIGYYFQAGHFVFNSQDFGHGDINSDLSAFGLFGQDGKYAHAKRNITTWGNAHEFHAEMAAQWRDGNRGISLYNNQNVEIWNLNITNDGYGQTDWSYHSDIIIFIKAIQNGSNLVINLTGFSKDQTWTGTYSQTIMDQSLNSFRFYSGTNSNTGNWENNKYNLYFNNLKIISPWALKGTTNHLGSHRFSVSGLSSFSDFTLGSYNNNNILPIELLAFTANYRDPEVWLNWATGSEVNNDYFTLERSRDTENAEIIGFVEGSGNSTQTLNYQFIDINPLPGVSYYRLKQTDFDGKFEYSQWVAIETENLRNRLQVFAISQSEGLKFNIFSPGNRPLQIQLVDIFGRIIYSQQISPDNSGQVQTFLPLTQGSNSVLIYRVTDGVNQVTDKIIR